MVAKKVGDPFEIGAPAGNSVTQIEPAVAEWRIGQARVARLIERSGIARPEAAVEAAAGRRDDQPVLRQANALSSRVGILQVVAPRPLTLALLET